MSVVTRGRNPARATARVSGLLLCPVLFLITPVSAQDGAAIRSQRSTEKTRAMLSRDQPLRPRLQPNAERSEGLDDFRMFGTPSRAQPSAVPAPQRSVSEHSLEEKTPRTQEEVVDHVSRVLSEATVILKAKDAEMDRAARVPLSTARPEPETPSVTVKETVQASPDSYSELVKLNATPSEAPSSVGACRIAAQRSKPFATFDSGERIDILVFDPDDALQQRQVSRLARREASRAIPYHGETGDTSLMGTDPARMFVDSLGLRCVPSRIVSTGNTLWFYEGSKAFETTR